jgi:hypothetical protein
VPRENNRRLLNLVTISNLFCDVVTTVQTHFIVKADVQYPITYIVRLQTVRDLRVGCLWDIHLHKFSWIFTLLPSICSSALSVKLAPNMSARDPSSCGPEMTGNAGIAGHANEYDCTRTHSWP